MKDRQSTYPGRVQLVPVAGQTNIYDMTMADEPTEEGDAPVKAKLLSDTVAAAIAAFTGESTPYTVNEALSAFTQKEVITIDLLETINVTTVPSSTGATYGTPVGLVDYDFIIVSLGGSLTRIAAWDSTIGLGTTYSSPQVLLIDQGTGSRTLSRYCILTKSPGGYSGGANADRNYYAGVGGTSAFTLGAYSSGTLGCIYLGYLSSEYISAINITVKFYGIKIRGDI